VKNYVDLGVITTEDVEEVVKPPPTTVVGITVCPCVAADGDHFPTAVIVNDSFDLSALKHKPSDFRFVKGEGDMCNFIYFFILFCSAGTTKP
jgi:hypothetical protein